MARIILAVLVAWAAVAPTGDAVAKGGEAKRAEYIRANYAKYEYRIPMRDGVHLFTAVYVPYDVSEKWPLLLFRTPYAVRPYGEDRYKTRLGPSAAFEKDKFIFVFQDVRGKHLSEGKFVNMRPHIAKKSSRDDVDESTDTYDTIAWLLDNLEGHNGKVGQWGISYPGFYSTAGMIDGHPALRAVSPQAPIADWFWDDMHHHGAFILNLAFNFFVNFGTPRPEPTAVPAERFDHHTPDGYQFFMDLGPLANAEAEFMKGEVEFWRETARHPNYDEFWQSRNILPHLKNLDTNILVVGGWFDAEDLYGPLRTYEAAAANNKRGNYTGLVMGPWSHGGWNRTDGDALGDAEFGFKTAERYRDEVELPFFQHFLKGKGEWNHPKAMVFETGTNRWRRFDAWPPKPVQPLDFYLGPGQGLATSAADRAGFAEYPSDPSKPVPYTAEITTRWHRGYMTEDQRFASRRPDVVVFQTEPLSEAVTVAGPLDVELFVSTDQQDADWVVKLVDVHPNEIATERNKTTRLYKGAQQSLVRGDVIRGRFRNSYENPEPFVPGEIAPVRFQISDTLHTFMPGHRIQIQIQSSWFPLVDRNPQSWVDNIFEAKESDFVKATHRVHFGPEQGSKVRVYRLPGQ